MNTNEEAHTGVEQQMTPLISVHSCAFVDKSLL
jgi:hypothetical protein